MNPKDLIKAKEEASSVSYQSFVLLTGNFPNDLFCFLEGKDAPYYHFRLKTEYTGEIHYITCHGKKNVLKVKDIINNHKEYKSYNTSYFIDLDYDISLRNSDNKLYETPCYSIENLYCSPSSVKDILKCEFQLLESDKEFQVIYSLYSKLLIDFSEAILLFNSWYSLQKEKSRDKGVPNNINLENTLPKDFIEVSLDKVENKYDLDKIKEKFNNSINVNQEELEKKMNDLRNGELYKNLRGKYIFSFLINFIRSLINDANTKNEQKYLSKKAKFNIDYKTGLSTLSPYAETPTCLKTFIKNL